MKTLKTAFLGLLLFACTNSNSQQADLLPNQIIDQFFKLYESDGSASALDYILSTNKWVEEGAPELKTSVQNLVDQIGLFQGQELIVKRSIGENYLLYSYMIKHERQPIRFQFIFYRPSKKWQLQDFRYDDDLDTELIEAANAYRLTENLPGNDN